MRALATLLSLVTGLFGLGAPAHARPDDPHVEIVGGELAGHEEFPWMVKLSNGCAGTLVRPRHVLTAAHCVKNTRSVVVTAGSTDVLSPETEDVRSERITRAEGFETVTEGDDWAVVKLARSLDLPPVDLPSGGGLDGDGTFVAIGWGAIWEGATQQRLLRKVSVPYINDQKCQELYREHGYRLVPSEMLCAGDTRAGGKDTCQGDSGGPLLRRHDNHWVQVGIVSWGIGCGRRDAPGVYTQVSHFMDDIRAAVSIE